MSPTIVVLTGLVTGLAALALTRWMHTVAGSTASRWLRSGLHVAVAALGGAGAAALARGWPELVAFAVLALACGLLVVIDLAAYRLPDRIVGPMYPVLFVSLAIAAATGGDWGRLGRAAAAAVVLALAYVVLALIAPSNLGLGDVKLSGLLGAFLGWLGWSHTLVGTLAAFILSGIVAVVLLVTTDATRRTSYPFGPWMIVGAAIGAAWGPAILTGWS